jgi:UDP-glucose 4-epimerase
MNILVTGGTGFVGTILVKRLIELGHTIRIINTIEDIRFWEKDGDYDMVIHLASLTSPAESIKKPYLYFDINAWGTYRIFNMFKYKRLVNISSCVVYPCISPYGLSKKLSEVITDYFPNSINLRIHNLFGEGEKKHLVQYLIKKMLKNEDIILIADGLGKRDDIYIGDAIDTIIKYAFSDVKGLIQVGYKKSRTTNEMFGIIATPTGYNKIPSYTPDKREGDPDETCSDNDVGGIGFDEGLRRTIEYYKNV